MNAGLNKCDSICVEEAVSDVNLIENLIDCFHSDPNQYVSQVEHECVCVSGAELLITGVTQKHKVIIVSYRA